MPGVDSPGGVAMKVQRSRLKLVAGLGAVGVAVAGARYYATRPGPPAGEPLSVSYGELPAGKLLTLEWQGRNVFILRRTAADIAALAELEAELVDPESRHSLQPAGCRNRHRSLSPEVFVAMGQCTHQGCIPALRTTRDGRGEFLCPCHTARYDLAGRVFREGPAPANLIVPEYRLAGAGQLVVGES